jgi:hypothetical protein
MRKRISTNTEPWYGAQMVFRDQAAATKGPGDYEERVVLIRANSEKEAFAKAEAEAREYCQATDMQYLGFVRLFHIFDEKIGDKTEVFSIKRDSKLGPKAYLDRFFDTGAEYERHT